MKIKKQRCKIFFKSIIIAIVFYWFISFFFGFPIPRGTRVCADYSTYYENWRGIYYISVGNVLNLINFGHWGYLEDVDKETFIILDDNWAKDKNHVWYQDKTIKTADVASFDVDKSGLPKDKNHVYVYDVDMHTFRPSKCNMDVATAEHFIFKNDGQDWTWIRDRNFVYYDETKLDVDRNSFAPLGKTYWWTDKDYVYIDSWNSSLKKCELIKVDSLQSPVDTLNVGSYYLRNGRNIIHLGSVIARDIEVYRFEEVGLGKCIINDMLFENGERILKDSLNVPEAKFYFYGHIAADKNHVFYSRKQLNDIDAASFRQIDDKIFEDKYYIYIIKENVWREEYPFNRKRKQ
ncbi:MAG: DKNYY domain-containing protein [Bacteroidaceae bacterium]|nr:DKNYY domain-containing protein [Bacteroidaceae bacterium]